MARVTGRFSLYAQGVVSVRREAIKCLLPAEKPTGGWAVIGQVDSQGMGVVLRDDFPDEAAAVEYASNDPDGIFG